MKTFLAYQRLIIGITLILCVTALLIVGLWGNKYALYYIAWVLLLSFFTWQQRS